MKAVVEVGVKKLGCALRVVFDMASQMNSTENCRKNLKIKSSQNFMVIRIQYPNHREGCHFLCFRFVNC